MPSSTTAGSDTADEDGAGQSDQRSTTGPAPIEDLIVTTPAVDTTAKSRCEVFDYPCGWDGAADGAMAASFELLEATRSVMIEAGRAEDGVEAAAAFLAEDDRVVEILPDLAQFTGIQFRLEGAPPVILDTEYAGPIGDDTDRERVALPDDVVLGEPVGFRSVPERYRPVGGPLTKKTAVVIDPYASVDESCEDVSFDGLDSWGFSNPLDWDAPVELRECRQTGDGYTEAASVAGVFRSRSEDYTTIRHLRDSAANPTAIIDALSDADAVHIVSHGTSNCFRSASEDTLSPDFQLPDYDPENCYSMMALGPLSSADRNAARNNDLIAPSGTSFSDTRWWATTDFIATAVPQDAIVFGSHCTSANGALAGAGKAGFVGWHGYARITSAVDAAIRFWTLMVKDGVEFDVAYETLRNEGLHRSRGVNPRQHYAIDPSATLVAGGTNPRARDVVTAMIDGADLGGQVLRVNGVPGDTNKETFPHSEQALTFLVEGVKRGTASSVTIEVYKGDEKLESNISLSNDGQVVEPGADWDDWLVTVRPDSIKIGPTTGADFAPGAMFDLEIRVFERSNVYTADKGPVRLGVKLASVGPIPIFEELESAIAGVGGEVEGNEFRIEFDTEGGDVTGGMRVVMKAQGLEVGFWDLALTGTYDPESHTMNGNITGESRGQVAGISVGDSGSGTWEATANLDAQNVTGTIGINGQSQLYNGTIEAVS